MSGAQIARKRFGQHFLHERGVIDKIIAAIDPQADDVMVEIGPGLGALTAPLCARVKHVHAIEIDRDKIAELRRLFAPSQLTIHEGDALKFDFAALGSNLRLVGNLPYNISTPLLFHVGAAVRQLRDCTFMLQREVVERIVAPPGSKTYGRLSVMLQTKFSAQRLFLVAAGAFRPPPKVESAVLRLLPLGDAAPQIKDAALFERLVSAAFAQRRKTIANALRAIATPDQLTGAGIAPQSRAEQVPVLNYVRLANLVVGMDRVRSTVEGEGVSERRREG